MKGAVQRDVWRWEEVGGGGVAAAERRGMFAQVSPQVRPPAFQNNTKLDREKQATIFAFDLYMTLK